MSILRKRVTSRFVTIPNAAVEDGRLSFKARGILAYLLAKPDGWAVRSEQIADAGREGRDAVRTGLRELEEFGYYRRYTARTPSGQIVTVTRISDTPIDPQLADPDEVLGAPTGAGLSGAGSPDAGKPGPLVKTLEQIPPTPPKGGERARADVPDDDPDWSRFWSLYPRKTGKGSARRSWARAIAKESPEVILAAVRRYAGTVVELRYCPHPTTWLNQERWSDDLGGTAGSSTRPINVRSKDEECPIHAGQHRDRCGGCAADAKAIDRPAARTQQRPSR